MTKILSVFFGLVATTAFADRFDFTYFGNSSGSYTMVACDYATYEAETLFAKFGLPDVRVDCSGGILPNGVITPLSLRAEFTPVAFGENARVVRETYESDDFYSTACDFHVRLVRALVPEVKNVTIVRKSDACFTPMSTFSYDFDVKLPR